ncbi:MAG: glycerophosphodiester phosphodiesterase [Chloroflexi bacterium]|nr:MAG: glycerophosphodiester phosphodiesterase [Chloroflexota bacterium]TME16122.1 MAG: glycerophosphodiester phosphodiesterase [Chloroflexota bacterium]
MRAPITIQGLFDAARRQGRILLGGHQGNPADFPANTLSSFRSAIELGCDLVECDVHLSLDGELVVIHDHLLDATTNGKGPVGLQTFAELRRLDAGRGEKIPVLAELLELVQDKVGLVVETKQNPIPYAGLEEKLARALEDAGMTEQVSVISFHHPLLRKFKELAPGVNTGIIDASRPADPIAMLRAANADGLSTHFAMLDPEMVEEVRAAGGGVGVWTVDDEIALAWSKHCGPDSVFTNRPGWLAPLLN